MKDSPMGRRTQLLILLGLFAAGGALRFYDLGQESIWGDEAYSLRLASMDTIADIAAATARDAHPPAYYICLRLWRAVFPLTLISLRASSAFASLLTIPVFWLLARKMAGPFASIAATAFLALSPFHVWYAQEARMYAFLVFSEVLMVWAFHGLMEPWSRRPRAAALTGTVLFLSTGLAIHTHFFAIFLIAFIALVWSVRLARKFDPSRAFLLLGWLAWAGVNLAPYLFQMANRMKTGQGIDWIPPLSSATLEGLANAFFYGVQIAPHPPWIVWPLGAAFLWCLASSLAGPAPETSQTPDSRLDLWLFMACALGLPLAWSALVRPILFYGQRYEIIATIPFYLLTGLGLANLRSAWSPAEGSSEKDANAADWNCGRPLPPLHPMERGPGGEGGRATASPPLSAQRRGGGTRGGSCPVWIVPFAIILCGMFLWHLDCLDGSRQKRQYDQAALFLERQAADRDAVVASPENAAACLRYYLKRDLEFLPEDAQAIHTRLVERAGQRVWFVTVDWAPGPLEKEATRRTQAGPQAYYELEDIPGVVLRVTGYRIGPFTPQPLRPRPGPVYPDSTSVGRIEDSAPHE